MGKLSIAVPVPGCRNPRGFVGGQRAGGVEPIRALANELHEQLVELGLGLLCARQRVRIGDEAPLGTRVGDGFLSRRQGLV